MSSIAKFISDNPYLSMLENQCSTMSDLRKLHAQIIKTGLINNPIASTRVLAFSASPRRGDPYYAHAVFARIANPNSFAWNTIIRTFSNSSDPEKALSLFLHMLVSSSAEPQRLTYPSVFKACARLGNRRCGSQLHGRIIKLGLRRDEFVRNSLLSMYGSCGLTGEARQVFDESPERDVVAWNSMIMAYSKSGEFEEARRMFKAAPERNSVSWNSVISGCVRNGKLGEALELFGEMQERRVEPSEFTMVSLLNACGGLGAVQQGEWVHGYIERNGLESNPIVVTAIVDMYGKCGCAEKALRAFELSASEKNPPALSCWNAMIAGLATNGREREAIELFSRVESPDKVSFLAVLTACRHAGMVDEARGYLSAMTSEKHRIKPTVRHYTCVVDVLGRAGLLEEAERLISSMAVEPDAIVWGSLLSACERHGDVERAERAAGRVVELNPRESSAHVLMSNAYAGSTRFDDAVERRAQMRERGVAKEPGCSSIEVDGEVHEFVALGRTHPRATEIYSLLSE